MITTTTKLVVSMKSILPDNANKHHSIFFPCCVFYPKTAVNILGVLALGTLFGDSADANYPLAEDFTTIKLYATESHFIWDIDRHERHFMHGSSQMSELYLYFGHGYFTDFAPEYIIHFLTKCTFFLLSILY